MNLAEMSMNSKPRLVRLETALIAAALSRCVRWNDGSGVAGYSMRKETKETSLTEFLTSNIPLTAVWISFASDGLLESLEICATVLLLSRRIILPRIRGLRLVMTSFVESLSSNNTTVVCKKLLLPVRLTVNDSWSLGELSGLGASFDVELVGSEGEEVAALLGEGPPVTSILLF